MSRFVLVVWGLLLALALGCAITDYPVIEDSRGGYTGIVRTGHKAYVFPSTPAATLYADGSDELFSMVYQNAYGDQQLYTFNNFDPTGAVNFLDQTYCDWKYEGCEIVRAWNPVQNDDSYDGEFQTDCLGYRSLTFLDAYTVRIGECGDVWFGDKTQAFAEFFANLSATTWRGEEAYHVPVDAGRASLTITDVNGVATAMPIFGQHDVIITKDLTYIVPMKPNMRHQMSWLRGWAEQHGTRARIAIEYGGLRHESEVVIRTEGLLYNEGRF